MTYYHPPYPPPPPPRHRGPSSTVWIIVGLLIVVAVFLLAIFAMVASQTGRQYSQEEQQFLTQVHNASPSQDSGRITGPWTSWPKDDSQLIDQGHEICAIVGAHHGDRDAPVLEPPMGKSAVPSWMWGYSIDQREELVAISVETLCTKYAIWAGGSPI